MKDFLVDMDDRGFLLQGGGEPPAPPSVSIETPGHARSPNNEVAPQQRGEGLH